MKRSQLVLAVALGVVWLTLAISSGRCDSPTGLSVGEIGKGVRALRSQVQSFTVTLASELKTRGVSDKGVGPKLSPVVPSTAVYTWVAPNKFSYSIQSPSVKPDGTLTPPLSRKGSYDGAIHKEMSGESVPTRGWISAQPLSVPLGIDPRDIFFMYSGGPIDEELTATSAAVESDGVGDPPGVSLLTSEITGADKLKRRYRFVVSPTQGFATVLRESLQFVPARKAWLPYLRQEFSDYTLSRSGVWVPGKCRQVMYLIDQKSDGPSAVMSEVSVLLSNYSINFGGDGLPMDTVFPAGLQVTDHRSGKTLIVVDATSHSLDAAVIGGREIYEQVESRRSNRWVYIVLTASILSLTTILLAYVWRCRGRGLV